MIDKKLDQQVKERINYTKKKAQYNVDYVKELQRKQKDKKKEQGEGVLNDPRFKGLFDDENYKIDQNSEHYQQLKTTRPKQFVDSDDEADKDGAAKPEKDSDSNDSDQEVTQKNMSQYKPRNLNNLFADKEDEDDGESDDDNEDGVEDETFGKKTQ